MLVGGSPLGLKAFATLADTSSGFAGMGVAYTLIFGSVAFAFSLAFGYSVVVSAWYVRRVTPEWSLWPSRGVALLKQLGGWSAWAYFGWLAHSGFFIDSRRPDALLHATMLTVLLWLLAVALAATMLRSEPGPQCLRVATRWFLWDFALISVPLYAVSTLIKAF
ncbi:MAG: hypothetical protein AAFV43_02855 [Planctomycetota bacterium]